MVNVIEVHNVSKSYGRVKALDDVSFSVGKVRSSDSSVPMGQGRHRSTAYYALCCDQMQAMPASRVLIP